MLSLSVLFVLLCLVPAAQALYGPKSNVVEGTSSNFKDEVLKHDGVVIVEFFAPWCGHCKSLVPEYDKAASTLKGVVKLVGVDATQHESLAQKYAIQGFPTLKVFGADKKQPTDYQGARTSDGIVSEAMKQTNQLIKDRKAGKSKASSGGGEKKEKKEKKKGGKKGSDVIELNDVNFNALVLDSDEHWMVEFFAPWCGHCKALAPKWEKAATKLAGSGVKLGALDATASPNIAQQYEVKGYPTIKLFGAGSKKGKIPVDYNQAREVDAIVDFALSTLEEAENASPRPVSISQLVDQDGFENTCGKSKLCAVLFLPHILDTGAEGRHEYLRTFTEIAQEVAKLPFAFVWVEANSQPALENTLNINGNFPTLAVLSVDKKVFAVPKISWTRKNMSAFLSGVLSGTEKSAKFDALPAISAGPAWDGKDGELVVDEISLDDLFGDDE